MRVLFTTLREKSHLFAMLPFIEASLRRGHEVGVAAPAEFAERVSAAGALFFPVGHPGDEGLRPIWQRFAGASPEDLVRIAIGDLFAGACAEAATPSTLEVLEQWRPAVVLSESHEFSGVVAAAKVGVPYGRIAISAPGAEQTMHDHAAPFVDAHLRRLGLPADPHGERLRRATALTLFPAEFDPVSEAPAARHAFKSVRPPAPPLPSSWWSGASEATGAPKPFVYASLGTVTGRLEVVQAQYRATLDALEGLPVRALLTIGSDLPLEALGAVPANVQVERFVPQDEVLPHAAAVLCHGGSGTVLGALAARVPLVVTPFFADQPHNARRLVALGAGLAASPAGGASAVREALARVLAGPSFQAAAARLGEAIAALPPIDEAALIVERLAGEAC